MRERKVRYNSLYEKYSRDEFTFFNKLDNEKKEEIYKIEKEIDEYKSFKEPLRFKFLSLNTTIENKIAILRKYEEFMKLNPFSSEYSKLGKWISTMRRWTWLADGGPRFMNPACRLGEFSVILRVVRKSACHPPE